MPTSKVFEGLKKSTRCMKSTQVYEFQTYRMSHRVLPTFKLVYGHLNGNFLTGNFAWAFARQFENSGQKDFAKF